MEEMEAQLEQISRREPSIKAMQENVAKIETRNSSHKPTTSFHRVTSANSCSRKDLTVVYTLLRMNTVTKSI